jgi:Xaa-Pro dipeptidase
MLLNKPRAQRTMKDAGLDALIATGPTNVAYMSDYFCESSRNNKGVQVYGIVPVEDSVPLGLVVPSLEVDSWAEQPGDIADVTVYGTLYRQRGSAKQLAADDQRIVDLTISRPTHGGPVEALVEALRARGLTEGRLGVDETGLLPAMWEQFKTALPKAQITPAASLFQVIRMVKTEEELRRMARSAAITEEAMGYAWGDLRDGITELELATRFRTKVTELGADPAFWIISVGRRTAHTHNRQANVALRRGELVKFDMGCRYEWYWSDVGRTKVLGEATDKQRRLYEILCGGVKAATAKVRPGVRASDLFETAVQTIRDAGIPDYKRHHTGHGIGIDVYDPPIVQERGYKDIFGIGTIDPPMEVGQVTNIETPYYLMGEFGFIVEDTMIVRENGPELLTHLDYSLTVGK